jgi:hypothetical protein
MGGVSDDQGDLIAKFDKWDVECSAHWTPWRKEARECFDFVAGRQWDKTDEDELIENQRQPVVFNRVGTIIDAVVGSEIQGRQQVQYFPREVGDSGVNELLTKGAEWIRDQADAETEESDAFRDAFICGLGWTETRMDYEEEVEGRVAIERIDPLEMGADPSCRKPNLVDARYLKRERRLSKEAAEELFPGASFDSAADGSQHVADPRRAYKDDEEVRTDEVVVCEYQWFETETVHLAEDPQSGRLLTIPHDQLEEAQAAVAPTELKTQTVRRRKYWRAFRSGGTVLKVEELPDGEFTYKAITGKRDRNKGTWYGLVRPMMDPQRWANKFFSQILHIINSNAKGGIVAEESAFADVKQAEESWSKSDAITWANPGALQSNAIQPKVAPPVPAMLPSLMEMSIATIRDTTGVNQELLGMADRQQPGVLEHQRKQSAYGILAAFFESFRRYRKLQGRLLLKYIQKYVPEGTLVRIVGDDGVAQYIPLAKQSDTAKFDVIVDEAPAGPNQKERVFSLLMQFQPMLKDAGPEVWAELIRYSPLPDALAQKLAQIVSRPPDPQTVAMQQAGQQAEVEKNQAAARKDNAQAAKTEVEAQHMAFGPMIPAVG